MSFKRILKKTAAAALAAAVMVSAGLLWEPAHAASLEFQGDNGADSSMPVYLSQEALKPADMLVTESVTLKGTTVNCKLTAQQPLVVTNNEDSKIYVSEMNFVPENGWQLTAVDGTNFKALPADSKVLGLKVKDHDLASGPYRDFAVEANSSASLPVSGYSCPVSSDTTATAGRFQLTMSFFEMVISASADDAAHGYVTGGGGCDQGGEVTLEAVGNAGYGLDHWEDEEGNTVSTDATWTFKPTKSAHYTAVFSAPSGTTLYSDGTLVINEVASQRAANANAHGAVTAEYAAYTEGTTWNSETTVPWVKDTTNRNSIKAVEFGSKTAPDNMAYWFCECRYLESLDSTNLDTSNVTDMSLMFRYAGYSVTTFNLDLSGWNTANVTAMNHMFSWAGYNATTWDIGDLSGWNTSKVTRMDYMFQYTGKNAATWDIGDLSGWNTANVTDMSSMFSDAGRNATTWNIGDIGSWNTSKVTRMDYMFYYAGRNATTWDIGDLSNWNTSNVTKMNYMFVDAGLSATTWDIGDISGWDVSNVTIMSCMFDGAGKNATTYRALDLSGWNVAKVTSHDSFKSVTWITEPSWVQ